MSMEKRDWLYIPCPYCTHKNKSLMMIRGDILERKIICSGCAKSFLFNVVWSPAIHSFKEPSDA